MLNDLLIVIGGILPIIWGTAHIIYTKGAVRDFGEISKDNQLIITMEWVYEGITLIYIGSLIVLLIVLFGSTEDVVRTVCLASALMLFIMALWSLLTGFKIDFLPFKLCPLIFTSSAVLILIGIMI
ncbi:MAG: hypothetical protein ACW98F_17560 [Candidatus Hodarchaeales archaeon]|jgi:hypothetical protein